jgi:hypothetical protein
MRRTSSVFSTVWTALFSARASGFCALLLVAFNMIPGACRAQVPGSPAPLSYDCQHTTGPITIDGKGNDAAWQKVPWTSDFVDIQGAVRPKPRYRTRVKMLWDEHYLYVLAQMQEPDVLATLTKHDSVIFKDNDFEIFIKPLPATESYYEFEINALNTEWDLFLNKPYNEQGKPDNSWEIPGLKTAVSIQGTLNNQKDNDQGWTVEVAYPWKAFDLRQPVPAPHPGTLWRINFSRVEWTKGNPVEDNWVWSPQGVINMHVPSRWGYLHFR